MPIRIAATLAILVMVMAGCVFATPMECGRLSQEDCTEAAQVAHALLPNGFEARRIVAEFACGPAEFCQAGWNVFVVFEPREGDDLAFTVDRSGERVEAGVFPVENLPPHVIALLDPR